MNKTRSLISKSSHLRGRANDYALFGFLVVDNDQGIQEIISDVLRTCRARHILTTSNGEQALARLATNHDRCDVVISDCKMTPVDGLELLKTIRDGKVKDVEQDLPFIMITGYGDIPLVKKAKELKVSGFLAKPVSLEKLTAAVNKALGLAPAK